jgi:ABC-type antimicrobial peptide transport system permease subunit
MVWFNTIIEPMSYVISFVLTVLAAFLVNFVFYFKLDGINMAEALKSVE